MASIYVLSIRLHLGTITDLASGIIDSIPHIQRGGKERKTTGGEEDEEVIMPSQKFFFFFFLPVVKNLFLFSCVACK